MIDQEDNRSLHNRAHILNSIDHESESEEPEATENIDETEINSAVSKNTHLAITNNHQNVLYNLGDRASTKKCLHQSCKTSGSFEKKEKSHRSEQTAVFTNSTNVMKESNKPVSQIVEVNLKSQATIKQQNSSDQSNPDGTSLISNRPTELLSIEWKIPSSENDTMDKHCSQDEYKSANSSPKSQEKSIQKIVSETKKSEDDDFYECNEYIEKSSNCDVKRKATETDNYPGSLKKTFIKIDGNITVKGNKCISIESHKNSPTSSKSLQDMLKIMNQEKVYSFNSLFSSEFKKIGEGSFGEVYSGKDNNNVDVIYKVAPFEPNDKVPTFVNGGFLKGCQELTVEYIITNELSKLREGSNFYCDNFVRLYRGYIVDGMYPKSLLDAWKKHKENNKAFNQDPCEYKDKVKNYMILELEDAGVELEKYENLTISQGYSIIFQLIYCMRVAEHLFFFEHRDLHESNILIQQVDSNVDVEYTLNSIQYKLKSHGVKIKIIDYTLSRITLEKEDYYFNLEEFDELFKTSPKEDGFETVYPELRKLTKGDWSKFCPKSNLLWIIYHVRRFFSTGVIKDNKFVDFFLNNVSKMNCLEELIQDKTFISFQEDYVY